MKRSPRRLGHGKSVVGLVGFRFFMRGKNLVIIKSSGASIATVRAQTRPHFKLNHTVVCMEDNVK